MKEKLTCTFPGRSMMPPLFMGERDIYAMIWEGAFHFHLPRVRTLPPAPGTGGRVLLGTALSMRSNEFRGDSLWASILSLPFSLPPAVRMG